MMGRNKSELFSWLLQRQVHEYLDTDGRPVGEGRSAAYQTVETRFKTCTYPGSRFKHAHPMNMSALQSVTPHWQNLVTALGWLGQRCQAYYGKPVSTFYDLALVSGTGVFLTDYLALRPTQPLAEREVPVFLAGLYKIALGFQQATFLAMMNDRFKTDATEKTLPDAKGFYAWLEAEQLLIGEAEVCAGAEMMICKAYEAMKNRPEAAEPEQLAQLDIDWPAFDTFSTHVSNLWRKVILFVIQMQDFRITVDNTANPALQSLLDDSFKQLLDQQSGLAVELARLTLAESGRSLAEWTAVQAEFLSEIGYQAEADANSHTLAQALISQLEQTVVVDAASEAAIHAQLARYAAFETAALQAFNTHLSAIQQALGNNPDDSDSADRLTVADLAAIYGHTLHDWPQCIHISQNTAITASDPASASSSSPVPTGMERLRFMAGEWEVVAHVMGEEGVWVATPLPTTTSITRAPGGTFHQEIMPVAYGELVTQLFFSWSYDPYRHVYRMVSCDSSTGLMDVLEGQFEADTDTVVINDVRSGTTVREADGSQSYMQLASSKTGEDSFTDIVSESRDGGQSWTPVFRAIHTRKAQADAA